MMGNLITFVWWNIVFLIVSLVGFPCIWTAPRAVSAASTFKYANSIDRLTPDEAARSSLVASTKYNYNDEDFVIPQLKHRASRKQISADPSILMFTISVAALSLAKLFKWSAVAKDRNPNVWFEPFLQKLRLYTVGRCKPTGTLLSNDTSTPDVASVNVTGFTSNVDGNVGSGDSLQSHWEDQCMKLSEENAMLREQLLEARESLKQQKTELDKDDDDAEMQALNENLQYWKRVAIMNEQQANNAIQADRQSSIRQLEQLKTDMVRLVEQERSALLTEFQTMVAELRESLLVDT